MDMIFNMYLLVLLLWAVPMEQKIQFSKNEHAINIRRIFNVPVKDCMKECLARSLCHSIDYHRASKTCELNKATKDSNDLRKAVGWSYIEKSSFLNNTFSHCSCPVGKKCVVASDGSQCVFEECESLSEQGDTNMVNVGARSKHKLICVSDIAQFDTNRDSISNLFSLVCTSEGIWGIEAESSCYTIAFTLNSNTRFDPYLAWVTGANSRSDIECLTSFNCQHHYRSDLIELWNRLSISKIRFSIFKNQQEVQYIMFDGNNSLYTNWFSHIRVAESSWLDLVSTAQEIGTMESITGYFFSMQGHEISPSRMRRFYINKEYKGCLNDKGWFAAMFVNNNLHLCNWEKNDVTAIYSYSEQDTADVFDNSKQADYVYILIDIKP